jgi:hypothetical protein
MTTVSVEPEAVAAAELAPLSVEQYHRMIAAGILPDGEPIELLDGLLVQKIRGEAMTVSPRHSVAVGLLIEMGRRLPGLRVHLRVQGPLTIEPRNEPEPDGLVVRGEIQDYADRHPGPAEVTSAIEVADSSLRRDRTLKQRIYARAGVAQYVIVNLLDRQIEVYENPDPDSGRYGARNDFKPGEEVPLLLTGGTRLPVPVASLLP